MSAAILPLALVGVGQAQQMTCWCLKPNQTEGKEQSNCSKQHSHQKREDLVERAQSLCHYMEDTEDKQDMDLL